MPAVASRSQRGNPANPAKKQKLAQSPALARQNGLKALVNGTSASKPTAKINGARNSRKDRVDEATAVVGGGQAGHGDVDMKDAEQEVIEISSADEDSDDSSDHDDLQEDTQAGGKEGAAPAMNGHAEEEDRPVDEEIVDAEELSFGDRLRAQDPEPVRESHIVDVESTYAGAQPETRTLASASHSRSRAAPSLNSLGTVLTQALRTNDSDLLETCLRNVEIDAICATVERLPSPLVGTLLQKLAERLHKKPGRAGMLMIWVQWSLVAHGGYLASQPQLVKQLSTLNKVLKERANGLQPLLSLKGRLDMLHAQLDFRRRVQKEAVNDDEDEAVIYVEGEDDYVSSDEDEVEGEGEVRSGAQKRLRQDLDEDDESSIDEMPTTMEVNEDSEAGSEDSDNLLDDEAEETDADTGDEMSEPGSSDLEDGEDASESEEESKPARRSTAARAGMQSRR